MAELSSVYTTPGSSPEDLIGKIANSSNKPPALKQPKFGLDSVAGLLMSNVAAPLYLYASLRGKSILWDRLLAELPDEAFFGPSLDIGCGRGIVLLKTASRKKQIAERRTDTDPSVSIMPAYAIDIFATADQTGNSPTATYQNAAAAGVLDYTVLHAASFAEQLPFTNDIFTLITTSLAIHNADKQGRLNALQEMERTCAPGGRIIIVDLFWYFKQYEEVIKDLGFRSIKVSGAGVGMMYGAFPCRILTARKPMGDGDVEEVHFDTISYE